MEMDCIRTQATLSAVHDKEHVTDENAEVARAHCAECGQCRAFAANLVALDALPAPLAPSDLADRVMVAVSAIAAEQSAGQQAVLPEDSNTASADTRPSSQRFEWFVGRNRWKGFGALAAAAAAVVVIAVVVSRAPAPQTAGIQTPSPEAAAPNLTFSNDASGKSAASAPAATPAPARAPDYLTYKARVYAPGSLLAGSTAATEPLGTVTTAFAGAGASTPVQAYRSPLADGSIVVPGPDGSRLYVPVARIFSSVRYQLVAGNAVDRFGLWPELPGRFPVPTSPDGSPTFTMAGGDMLGVQTYTAAGVPQSQGFAIAPGTPSTDPAGSNPNWTWWEPLVIP